MQTVERQRLPQGALPLMCVGWNATHAARLAQGEHDAAKTSISSDRSSLVSCGHTCNRVGNSGILHPCTWRFAYPCHAPVMSCLHAGTRGGVGKGNHRAHSHIGIKTGLAPARIPPPRCRCSRTSSHATRYPFRGESLLSEQATEARATEASNALHLSGQGWEGSPLNAQHVVDHDRG